MACLEQRKALSPVLSYFEKLRDFALSGMISPYPGPRSVWIMDGAKVHCDPAIVNYLRALGIHVRTSINGYSCSVPHHFS